MTIKSELYKEKEMGDDRCSVMGKTLINFSNGNIMYDFVNFKWGQFVFHCRTKNE